MKKFDKHGRAWLLAVVCSVALCGWAQTDDLEGFRSWAPTPPMGWNSWDCYYSSVNEQLVVQNAEYMRDHLKQFGWEYVVVDIRWYANHPSLGGGNYNQTNPDCVLDEYGRYLPSPRRFPSVMVNGKNMGFKALADNVHVSFSRGAALWTVTGWGRSAKYKLNGIDFPGLLNHVLNNKAIQIYDGSGDNRAFNQEKTDAANVAAEELQQDFKDWIWKDKEREKRLVRYYNDNYNNTVVRQYDGSHLNLHTYGMNAKIELKPHQKDVVWRMLQSGNTLIAHCEVQVRPLKCRPQVWKCAVWALPINRCTACQITLYSSLLVSSGSFIRMRNSSCCSPMIYRQ